jgi:hypothetical protein
MTTGNTFLFLTMLGNTARGSTRISSLTIERREFRELIADSGPKAGLGHWDDPPNVEDIIELARVMVGFSRACKHPLSGLGCYHQYDGTEGETVREVMKLTEQRLQAREKYLKEDEEDLADGPA